MNLDPALVRGMTTSRRDALRLFGLAGAGLGLAACGVEGRKAAAPAAQSDVGKFWAGRTGKGHVNFANWPYYMDAKHTQLKQFTARTGISVTYKEAIEDNQQWFAKIQPKLAAGQSIGFDLMVITNSIQFSELTRLGYVAPLDHSKMPNFTKYAGAPYKNESYDPGNVYSVPYATGLTGIAYNPKYVTDPVTSITDLWNPKYKNKVGMFTDLQELSNFGMFATGTAPETSTELDWRKAAAKLKEQRDVGLVRKYYDQGYMAPLARGEIWITMAWSGDVFTANKEQGTDLQFVLASEGGTIWTDNMMIPKTAANPVDALKLIDFFYDPKVAASLTEYIDYVTPVPGAQQAIKQQAAVAAGKARKDLEAVADSPLVFPRPFDYAKLHRFRSFANTEEQKVYQSIFQPIVTS